jgi:hypothetical protein
MRGGKPKRDLAERPEIDLDLVTALMALLKVDPEAKPDLSDEEIEAIIQRVLADED